eukprot:GHVQ01004817.1.p1 GENE.GHVQ01004817.1~~GHVQ01004817.1.p1  ORF type:complete len:709 (+),score=76.38 GHVQ01004817.1:732-2858(+)
MDALQSDLTIREVNKGKVNRLVDINLEAIDEHLPLPPALKTMLLHFNKVEMFMDTSPQQTGRFFFDGGLKAGVEMLMGKKRFCKEALMRLCWMVPHLLTVKVTRHAETKKIDIAVMRLMHSTGDILSGAATVGLSSLRQEICRCTLYRYMSVAHKEFLQRNGEEVVPLSRTLAWHPGFDMKSSITEDTLPQYQPAVYNPVGNSPVRGRRMANDEAEKKMIARLRSGSPVRSRSPVCVENRNSPIPSPFRCQTPPQRASPMLDYMCRSSPLPTNSRLFQSPLASTQISPINWRGDNFFGDTYGDHDIDQSACPRSPTDTPLVLEGRRNVPNVDGNAGNSSPLSPGRNSPLPSTTRHGNEHLGLGPSASPLRRPRSPDDGDKERDRPPPYDNFTQEGHPKRPKHIKDSDPETCERDYHDKDISTDGQRFGQSYSAGPSLFSGCSIPSHLQSPLRRNRVGESEGSSASPYPIGRLTATGSDYNGSPMRSSPYSFNQLIRNPTTNPSDWVTPGQSKGPLEDDRQQRLAAEHHITDEEVYGSNMDVDKLQVLNTVDVIMTNLSVDAMREGHEPTDDELREAAAKPDGPFGPKVKKITPGMLALYKKTLRSGQVSVLSKELNQHDLRYLEAQDHWTEMLFVLGTLRLRFESKPLLRITVDKMAASLARDRSSLKSTTGPMRQHSVPVLGHTCLGILSCTGAILLLSCDCRNSAT